MTNSSDESLVAVFWDIENCGVPKGKSPSAVVQCIRSQFMTSDVKEAEFLCVCDVSREPTHLIDKLNEMQVIVFCSYLFYFIYL